MFRRAFPRCGVSGSVEPSPYNHLGLKGSIPVKCSTCALQLEGECTRAMDQTHGFLELDHGPCPITGDTHPVTVVTQWFESKVSVPAKCSTCRHLEVSRSRGFTCGFESERWGFFRRGLDWGSWSPELPNVGLSSRRRVSQEVLRAAVDGNEAEMVRAFRAEFPEASVSEARQAFAELRAQVEKARR